MLSTVFRQVRRILLTRSEEHTSELQSLRHLVCRLLLEKKRQTEPPNLPLGFALAFSPARSGLRAPRRPGDGPTRSPAAGLHRAAGPAWAAFFFKDPATPKIYTLPQPAALPI